MTRNREPIPAVASYAEAIRCVAEEANQVPKGGRHCQQIATKLLILAKGVERLEKKREPRVKS